MSSYKSNQEVYGARSKSAVPASGRPHPDGLGDLEERREGRCKWTWRRRPQCCWADKEAMCHTVKLGRAGRWLVGKVSGKWAEIQAVYIRQERAASALPPMRWSTRARPIVSTHTNRFIKWYFKCDILELLFLILWGFFPAVTCDFPKLKRKQEKRGKGAGDKETRRGRRERAGESFSFRLIHFF